MIPVIKNSERGLLEKKDIQYITAGERNKKGSSQFFLWFASNLTIGDLALGSLGLGLGISLNWLLVSVVIGNILGGILLAFMSVIGPKTGLPQMMIGRRSFGTTGGKIMSGLQWINSMGWFTFNSIIAATAVAVLLFGNGRLTYIPAGSGVSIGLYIFPILIVCILVALMAYFGERVIHGFEKAMSFVLGIMFVVILYYLLEKFGTSLITVSGPFSLVAFGTMVALSFSYIMSWGPYASDYSRYVEEKEKSSRVFIWTLLGSALASIFVEIGGYIIAADAVGQTQISEQVYVLLRPVNLAIFGLMAIFLGGLAANALNLYSNSLSMKSMGVHMRRSHIVLLVLIVAIFLSYFGYVNYYSYYEDFLYILDYWITPWLGIMIADFFIVGRASSHMEPTSRKVIAAIFSYVVSIAVSVPFMNPGVVYEGPVAKILGGIDISYFISFAVAMILYITIFTKFVSGKSVKGEIS